jgi:hypothetical protein
MLFLTEGRSSTLKHARKWAGAATLGIMAMALAGCGTQSVDASQFMVNHPGTHTLDLKVVSRYSSSQQINTFDGFTHGRLTITIPVGYHVNMNFINNGPIPESVGIYKNDHLAFAGAGESYRAVATFPTAGLLPGQSQSYTFTASRLGTFALTDELNGGPANSPTSGIWDTVKVVSSGSPGMSR